MKKFQFAVSSANLVLIGFITNACLSLFLFAGQTLEQDPQPVQSAAETCILNLAPLFPVMSTVLNDAGALARSFGSIALDLIAACGQTNVH